MPNAMTAWFVALRGLSERWQQLGRSTNSMTPMKLQISYDQPRQFGSSTTRCYGVAIEWTWRHTERIRNGGFHLRIAAAGRQGGLLSQFVTVFTTVYQRNLPNQTTNSTEHSPSWEANSSSRSQESPVFYGTQRFITAWTRTSHLSLTWVKAISSTPPNPTSWRSILILSSYLLLGLPSGLFPSGLPTKTQYAHLLPLNRATCPDLSFFLSWSY